MPMPSNKTQQQLCQFVVTYKRPINILTKLKEVTKICFLPTIFRNENVTNLIRHRIPRWSIKVGYWDILDILDIVDIGVKP